jgi:hypothetical protein
MFMEIVCEPPVRVPSWICQALVPVELTVTGVPPAIVAEKAERGTVVVGAGEREKFTTAAVL